MLGKSHRTAVSVSSRLLSEKAAARRFLHSSTTEADDAISFAANRLWRHARRTMNAPQPTGCIIICPEAPAPAGALAAEEGEDCITEAVGV